MKAKNALEIKELTKHYPTFQLKNVNLTLPTGTIVGFIGENGAGKTTTIKLILNELKKESGTIEILGLDYEKNEREIKQQLGVVLDEGFFYDSVTPLQISKVMACLYANWDQTLYLDFLSKFKLPGKQSIKEFSKGMRMKLSIAAALSHHPKLLILDEPTNGLDPIVRNELLDLFLEFIQDEEHSILFSSHITSDLEKIADYICFIHEGEIILQDSKDTILENFALIKCSHEEFKKIDPQDYISYRKNTFGCEALINDRSYINLKYPNLILDSVNLETIMMFQILKQEVNK
ncbi:ABC transporter ATP-binding protein [Sinanaerobacter sp. ZZT-01]|uniref:ABC transporter ATP-binding protein n=1 Tax=Sinanaerobacter sp. ZZT-01 TaxID=3111540 RepID=UPI002D7A1193|nr:ABC transporter ATP-binding protein [Sinanaerobacter sp. ZZT-01]WRR92803.1 ABC transporter ATP-binding protein [Sinanaerobacter sp. ZZT-01]